MALSTIKTIKGFLLTMVEKYTPLKTSKDSLEGIYNYLPISKSISTSGQPTEKQFQLIRDAGYQAIINLAPHNVENALPDEGAVLQSLGLRYIHIPVDFKNPTSEDFQAFTHALKSRGVEKVWIHCAANMRVSAFIYRYRVEVLKERESDAKQDLEKIWQPFGVWKDFVSKA